MGLYNGNDNNNQLVSIWVDTRQNLSWETLQCCNHVADHPKKSMVDGFFGIVEIYLVNR